MKKHRFWFQYIVDGDIVEHIDVDTDDEGVAMLAQGEILGALQMIYLTEERER